LFFVSTQGANVASFASGAARARNPEANAVD
jgi:hypothetical protein